MARTLRAVAGCVLCADMTEQVGEGQPRGLTGHIPSARPEDGSWDSGSAGWTEEVDAAGLMGRVLSVREQRGFGALGGARREKPDGRGVRQGSRAALQCPCPAPGHERHPPSTGLRQAVQEPQGPSGSLRVQEPSGCPSARLLKPEPSPGAQSVTMVISIAPVLAPGPARRLSMAFLTAPRLPRTTRTMALSY